MKIKSLLAAFIALSLVTVIKAQWTEWRSDYNDAGNVLQEYHRLNDADIGNGNFKHFIEFKENAGLGRPIRITHVICNDSALEGWCNLGPGGAESYSFNYIDDRPSSTWSWTTTIN
jgi:YD repeat-containing protein